MYKDNEKDLFKEYNEEQGKIINALKEKVKNYENKEWELIIEDCIKDKFELDKRVIHNYTLDIIDYSFYSLYYAHIHEDKNNIIAFYDDMIEINIKNIIITKYKIKEQKLYFQWQDYFIHIDLINKTINITVAKCIKE